MLRDNIKPRTARDTHCWRCKGLLAKDQASNTCSPCQRSIREAVPVGYVYLAHMPSLAERQAA